MGQHLPIHPSVRPRHLRPNTGLVASNETIFDVKVVMLELELQEYEGVFQQSDFKLIIDPGQIGNLYITTADRFVVPFPSGNKNCKVIDVVTYRGTIRSALKSS